MNNKKKIAGTVGLRDLLVADKKELLENLMSIVAGMGGNAGNQTVSIQN